MLQIVLIRPGSTEYDHQGRIQGTLDIPLSKEGHEQVAGCIERLREQPIEVIYFAPSESARQTAEAVCKALALKPRKLDKLHNLDHGLWQGMLIEDVKVKQPKVYRRWREQPEKVCPPGGEMVAAAKERVKQTLTKIAKKHKDGVIGLVAPEPLASLVCNILRNDELADFWKPADRCRWDILRVERDAVTQQ